jgi:hypothetical protein
MAHIKNLRKGGAQVLGGRRFVNVTTTKRRSAEAEVGGGVLVMRCDRGGTRCEDFFLSFGAANMATKK